MNLNLSTILNTFKYELIFLEIVSRTHTHIQNPKFLTIKFDGTVNKTL